MPPPNRVITLTRLRASVALPRTGFPMRAQAALREPAQVERLTTELYARQLAARRGQPEWVLHDGPPYANGSLHMGHFLNKVLKDIINRRALQAGKRVVYAPGWDCHGLPIELKVLAELRANKNDGKKKDAAGKKDAAAAAAAGGSAPQPALSPIDIRRLAAASAVEAIAGQAADFRRWGVLADWRGVGAWVDDARAQRRPGDATRTGDGSSGAPSSSLPPALYVTMSPAYEAAQLRVWAAILAGGRVHRALKPVHWSPSSKTALAEAELEYADDHVSSSVFVTFPLASARWCADAQVRALLAPHEAAAVAAPQGVTPVVLEAAVWTTTPWTLPANVALAVSGELEYSVVRAGGADIGGGDRLFLVASARVAELQRVLDAAAAAAAGTPPLEASPAPLEAVATLAGSRLVGALFAHPLAVGATPLPPMPGELRLGTSDGRLSVVPTDTPSDGTAVTPPPPSSLRVSPVILGADVTADSGTGIVHTAPGHGVEDFDACVHGRDALAAALGGDLPPPSLLPVMCPVDDDGRFTPVLGGALAGRHVLNEGTQAVLELLRGAGVGGRLLHAEPYRHRYPYDWRTKQPVIVRATQQWFVRLDGDSGGGPTDGPAPPGGGSVIAAATAALHDVALTPPIGRTRLTATLASRREWCVSRQRAWGVPVPVLYVVAAPGAGGGSGGSVTVDDGGVTLSAGSAYMSPRSVEHIASVVAAHGADAWWTRPAADFVPPPVLFAAAAAGLAFEKGTDTLDVWFDSGVSWAAAWAGYDAASPTTPSVPAAELPFGLRRPSDMVLEGSDQHRGWFQSSLLTTVAAASGSGDGHSAVAPYAAVVTHGFVLDERQRKMSKSLGNVIAPGDIINGTSAAGAVAAGAGGAKKGGGSGAPAGKEGLGADVLRLWAASADYTRDCAIGPSVIATVSEAARKLRNTARFLLANLHGWAPPQQAGGGSGDGAASPAAAGDALAARWSAPVSPLLLAPKGTAGGVSRRLPLIEALLLHRLAVFQREVESGFNALSFQWVAAALANLTSTELSAVYFDAVKDALYCDPPVALVPQATSGAGAAASALLPRRAAAQLVMWEALRAVTRALAPVQPFTAEDVYQHSAEFLLPTASDSVGNVPISRSTVFDAIIPMLPAEWGHDAACSVVLPGQQPGSTIAYPASAAWTLLMSVRVEVNRTLEAARDGKHIGASSEARVTLRVGGDHRESVVAALLRRLIDDGIAADVLLASQVELIEEAHTVAAASQEGIVFETPNQSTSWRYVNVATLLPPKHVVDTDPSSRHAPATITIEVTAARGGRCVRCRRYAPEVSASATGSGGAASTDSTSPPVHTSKAGKRPASDSSESEESVPASHVCARCADALSATGAW